MAQKAIAFTFRTHSAIVNCPDSEMKTIFLEGLDLLRACPEILVRIQTDIDAAAKRKKQVRQADAAWYRSRTITIPGMECDIQDFEEVILLDGRPRKMDAESTFFLMLVRGHISSVTSKVSVDRIADSRLIDAFFASRGLTVPAATTIHDYLQTVTHETRQFIFEQLLNRILSDGHDSMESLTIDSFSVAANSKWPTDSRILMGLLNRAFRIGSHLKQWGLPGFSEGRIPEWLHQLKHLNYTMALTAGKPRSKGKIKRYYRRFLKTVDKILSRLIHQYSACLPEWNQLDLAPSETCRVHEMISQIEADLHSVIRVYTYTEDRVFYNKVLPSPQKILSLSDTTAAFIKKGQRDPVIGYKPQVGRTRDGFISSFEIEPGNPSDSSRFQPMVERHIHNTGVTPKRISVDDGYSSKTVRLALCENEEVVVSISGAKGKKIIPDELWDTESYQDARRNRSSVESLIFTLRYKFDLWSFSRRGLDGVRCELTEKVIVHNLWRSAYLKTRQKLAA